MPDQNLWDFQKVRVRHDHRQAMLHRGGSNPDIIRRNRRPHAPQCSENPGIPLK